MFLPSVTQARWAWGLLHISRHWWHVGDHVEEAAEVAGFASLSTFFERWAEEAEDFQGGNASSAVVEVKMGVDGVEPASGVLDDVVGMEVEDVDFAELVVIEEEIAAKGSRGGIAQFLADEAGFEVFPFRMDAVDVGLGDDDLESPAFHQAAEQLDLVVEEVVGEQQIAQVVKERLRASFRALATLRTRF